MQYFEPYSFYYFLFSGPDVGYLTLFVTDGQFFWTGQFEVQASDPFLKIKTSTGITVSR